MSHVNHVAGAPIITDEVGEQERSRRLAERYRCTFVDLREQRIDPELFRSIPAELMFRFNFVPIESRENILVIAVADPAQVLLTYELSLPIVKHLVLNFATPPPPSDLPIPPAQSQPV